jgi:thiamine biosynthesis protein ThiI
MTAVVVHYKELSLKGRNRPWFIQLLVRNIKEALRGLSVRSVRSLVGRIEVELREPVTGAAESDEKARCEIAARLSRIFGIANFSFANRAPHESGKLAAKIIEDLGARDAESFCVAATRSDKRLPFTSPQVEREVGGLIKQARGWRVDLERPALTIHIELMTEGAFYYFEKRSGAGGLPTGTGGRVACLLSGGIDSPVAAYRMMRRGCAVTLVHFHSYPILSRTSQEKVREIVTLLTRHQLRSRLMLVPFGDVQQKVVLAVPPELRVVIYRRLMLRIAERLARQWHARGLVTGEVIGQVASQTLDNMATIAAVTAMPILRPLVGMDKDEITVEAERIGTFPISIIKDEDCCTLFTPRHPATRARLEDVEAAESQLALDDLVSAAVNRTVVETFKYPVLE